MSERHLDVSLLMTGDLERKVHAIKQVRGATGLGLREAKDLVELVARDGSAKIGMLDLANIKTLRDNLAECNMTVCNENLMKYAEQLREIASFATLAGDYYVARTIITLLDERF